MTRKVLVPIDGSSQSWEALEHAFEEFDDPEITVLNVVDPIEAGYSSEATAVGYAEEWFEQAKESAEGLFEEAQERADEHGIDLETAVEVGRPARTIVDYVDESEEIDYIVIGSHGRSGVSRVLLGSVAESVVRRSSVPVTIIR
jgi:nucleotide-binding universal stress UspA family protein